MSNEYYLTKLDKLVGGEVISAISDEEGEYFGLEIKTPNGKRNLVWFLQDDEGNGPGSFEIQDVEPEL